MVCFIEKQLQGIIVTILTGPGLQEAEKAKKLYEETINQCSEKDDLIYALENLQGFTDVIGKTSETEFVVNLLNEAIERLS